MPGKNSVVPLGLASRYLRQVYLITFPLGALLSFGYLWISASRLTPVNIYISVMVAVLLLVLFVGLLLNPEFLYTSEVVFYFSMCFYFVIYSHSNINIPDRIQLLTQEQLSDVISGMGMWLVIMFIGAFLSLTPKHFKTLLVIDFLVILFVSSINLYLLYSAGVGDFGFLYRWLNLFFALFVAFLLIQRIGRLQQLHAFTDDLTGLLNRRAMVDALTREIRRSERYEKSFSLILFDIDFFKSVNDTYGHSAGDRVLQEVSRIAKGLIRNVDYLGRWGGEEFLVILLETNLEKGLSVAERIRSMIADNQFAGAGRLTASFGVACHILGQSLDEILHAVDLGMYTAKSSGGNRVNVAESVPSVP